MELFTQAVVKWIFHKCSQMIRSWTYFFTELIWNNKLVLLYQWMNELGI